MDRIIKIQRAEIFKYKIRRITKLMHKVEHVSCLMRDEEWMRRLQEWRHGLGKR